MVSKEDIERLAGLARLEVGAAEVEKLSGQMTDIVSFVSQVQEISDTVTPDHTHRNVFREDGEPHESGVHTQALLKTSSASNGTHIVVPKIISND